MFSPQENVQLISWTFSCNMHITMSKLWILFFANTPGGGVPQWGTPPPRGGGPQGGPPGGGKKKILFFYFSQPPRGGGSPFGNPPPPGGGVPPGGTPPPSPLVSRSCLNFCFVLCTTEGGGQNWKQEQTTWKALYFQTKYGWQIYIKGGSQVTKRIGENRWKWIEIGEKVVNIDKYGWNDANTCKYVYILVNTRRYGLKIIEKG